jgi:hypothetical protein
MVLLTCGACAYTYTITHQIAAMTWQGLRQSLCRALHREKDNQINHIIENTYSSADVVCIQEAAAAYVDRVLSHPVLSKRYMVLHPEVQNNMTGSCSRQPCALACCAVRDLQLIQATNRCRFQSVASEIWRPPTDFGSFVAYRLCCIVLYQSAA